MDDSWTTRLSRALAATLSQLADSLASEPVAMFAIDCHPWQGGLYIAILKQSEVDTDALLADPAEMAAWEMYDCGSGVQGWIPATELATEMEAAYKASDDTKTTSVEFFSACVAALNSPSVRDAVSKFEMVDGFRISVAHPDDGTEFYAA